MARGERGFLYGAAVNYYSSISIANSGHLLETSKAFFSSSGGRSPSIIGMANPSSSREKSSGAISKQRPWP